ncbi:cellular nucleic acid-binding protein, partial [Trifolium medium]|nr:cellular nucleic acid-binding protein [Trifolium medium]
DGAQRWIEGIERIFGAMRCLDEHRVLLGGYANQRLGANGVVITWARFKLEFLTKYFPEDERNHKVIEFMELKQ